MILADTSVWIDHFRKADAELSGYLHETRVLIHPFVLGEIALGSLKNRNSLLENLAELPNAVQASDDEVLAFIEAENLAGSGIGYIDAHLLASARLTPGAKLWAKGKRLVAAAERLGLT
jgi:hypothetical protein